jgi:hypothetical protein
MILEIAAATGVVNQGTIAVKLIAVYALLNPATFAVAVYLGLRADEPQKIPLAGMIAGIAGMAMIGVLGALSRGAGWTLSLGHERPAGGMFIALMLVGCLWAGAAYLWKRRGR